MREISFTLPRFVSCGFILLLYPLLGSMERWLSVNTFGFSSEQLHLQNERVSMPVLLMHVILHHEDVSQEDLKLCSQLGGFGIPDGSCSLKNRCLSLSLAQSFQTEIRFKNAVTCIKCKGWNNVSA